MRSLLQQISSTVLFGTRSNFSLGFSAFFICWYCHNVERAGPEVLKSLTKQKLKRRSADGVNKRRFFLYLPQISCFKLQSRDGRNQVRERQLRGL